MSALMTSDTQWENTFRSMTNHTGGSLQAAENVNLTLRQLFLLKV